MRIISQKWNNPKKVYPQNFLKARKLMTNVNNVWQLLWHQNIFSWWKWSVCVRACVRACVCACLCVCLRVCVCVCVRARIILDCIWEILINCDFWFKTSHGKSREFCRQMPYASKKNHTGQVNSTQGLESVWKTALWGTAAYTVDFQSNIYQKITYLGIYTSYVGSGLFEIFFSKASLILDNRMEM